MRIVAIDTLDLTTLDLDRLPLIGIDSLSMDFTTRRRQGDLGSMFLGNAPEPAIWNVLFKPNDGASKDALLAALVGDMLTERMIVAERIGPDNESLRIETLVSVVAIAERGSLDFIADLEATDSVWVSEAPAVESKTFASIADLCMHIDVPGSAVTFPVIRITPEQRTTDSVYAGWKYRRRITIQNNSDNPWFRMPVRVSLGDTTALTPTKAQAGGDDVRVTLHGIEQPRTLVTWDSAASFVWVLVPNLPAGESIQFDLWYGNPSATNPPALAYPDIPAFNLSTSTNASLVWNPTTNGSGLYFISSSTVPFTVDYGTPGSWRPVITLEDEEIPDKSGVTYDTFKGNVGDNASAGLSIMRVPEDVEIFEQLQWRINGFDGMAFSWPLPMNSFTGTLGQALSTVSEGACVLLGRVSSADPWIVLSNSSGGGNLVLSGFSISPALEHIALALWPSNVDFQTHLNAVDFPANDYLVAAVSTNVTVGVDDTDLSITVGSEEEIVEVAGEVRIGGGVDGVAPYHVITLGNARQETGAGTTRLAVKLGNTLVVDCARHRHQEYDSSGILVEEVSAHSVQGYTSWDDDGEAIEVGSVQWLPMLPGETPVPNGHFGGTMQGWVDDGEESGTASVAYATGVTVGEVDGHAAITVSSAMTSGHRARILSSAPFPVGRHATVSAAATTRTDDVAIAGVVGIAFYDADDTLLYRDFPDTVEDGLIDTPYRIAHAARVPDNAEWWRINLAAQATAGGATGVVRFDDVTANATEVIYRNEAIESDAVEVLVSGAWLI